jgi:hypothetical protein
MMNEINSMHNYCLLFYQIHFEPGPMVSCLILIAVSRLVLELLCPYER